MEKNSNVLNSLPIPNNANPPTFASPFGIPLQYQYISSSASFVQQQGYMMACEPSYQPASASPISFSVNMQPAVPFTMMSSQVLSLNNGMRPAEHQPTIATSFKSERKPLPVVIPKRERRPLPIVDPKSLMEFSKNFTVALSINKNDNDSPAGGNLFVAYDRDDQVNPSSSFSIQLPSVHQDFRDVDGISINNQNTSTVTVNEPISATVNSKRRPTIENDTESIISTISPASSVIANSNESDDFIDKLKAILKKLTPRTFDESSERFLSLEEEMVTGGRTVEVVNVIFRKVSDEPRYCEMCAILCEMMTQKQTTKTSAASRDKTDNFRYQLMLKCQAIFELSKNNDRFKERRLQDIENEEDEETRNLLKIQLAEIVAKRKWHVLESIRFIGELCQRKLVSKFIAHLCIQHLLTKTNDFESFKCLCLFLRIVGKTLEEDRASSNVQAYFEELNKILKSAETRRLPQRICQEINNLMALRKNNWIREDQDIDVEFNFRTVECFICFEHVGHQKFLDCGINSKKHILCEKCIRKLSTKASWSLTDTLIECPICRSVTLLKEGNPSKLQTKFFVDLTCEDCSVSKPIEDQIWCKKCNITVCNSCAGHNHSSHECSHWENYDVPSECLTLLKNDRSQAKSKIEKFCSNLKEVLLKKVEEFEIQSRRFANVIEFGFGSLKPSAAAVEFVSIDVEEKKLKTVVQILKSRNLQMNEFDLEEIIKYSIGDPKLPSLDEALRFMQQK